MTERAEYRLPFDQPDRGGRMAGDLGRLREDGSDRKPTVKARKYR